MTRGMVWYDAKIGCRGTIALSLALFKSVTEYHSELFVIQSRSSASNYTF